MTATKSSQSCAPPLLRGGALDFGTPPEQNSRMRLVSFCLLLGLGACAGPPQVSTGQSVTAEAHEVFLVRHAEKQTGDNPSLTEAGHARAETLAQRLADTGLTHIHSTNYNRTLETAAPIAGLTGLPVVLYDPTDLDAFAEQLLAMPGVHLVVGHSNTTPALASALGGDPGTPIDEASEYDRLYVLQIDQDTATGRIERFGDRYQAPVPD